MLELNIIEVVNTMIKTGRIYSKTSVFSFNVKNYVMDPRACMHKEIATTINLCK